MSFWRPTRVWYSRGFPTLVLTPMSQQASCTWLRESCRPLSNFKLDDLAVGSTRLAESQPSSVSPWFSPPGPSVLKPLERLSAFVLALSVEGRTLGSSLGLPSRAFRHQPPFGLLSSANFHLLKGSDSFKLSAAPHLHSSVPFCCVYVFITSFPSK